MMARAGVRARAGAWAWARAWARAWTGARAWAGARAWTTGRRCRNWYESCLAHDQAYEEGETVWECMREGEGVLLECPSRWYAGIVLRRTSMTVVLAPRLCLCGHDLGDLGMFLGGRLSESSEVTPLPRGGRAQPIVDRHSTAVSRGVSGACVSADTPAAGGEGVAACTHCTSAAPGSPSDG